MYQRISTRVNEQARQGKPVREGDGAWVEALKWVLGGCVNGYHPPECDGRTDACYGEPGDWEENEVQE